MTSTDLDLSHPRDLNGATAPAGALAIQPGQNTWDAMQTAALAQLGLADAGDGDRAVFLHVCQRTGLDPFARQIYMIARNEKIPGTNQYRKKWTIQTGIDGFRVNRDRAERKAGVRGTLSRPVFYDQDGKEHKVWVQPRPPAACEITYTVKDRAGNETPYTSVLRFTEYAQTDSNGNLTGQWRTKGVHMLEKCTEADSYRKAYPQDFSGIHLDDAMPPAGQPLEQEPPPVPRGRVTAGEIITGDAEPPQTAAAGDDTRSRSRSAGNPAPAQDGAAGESTAQDARPRAAGAAPSRGAQPLPPLPGEDADSGSAPAGQPAGHEPATGPEPAEPAEPSTEHGTVTRAQITAIWTVLTTVYQFGKDEKDQARAVCAHIARHPLKSTTHMSRKEASDVLDTLASWQETAARHEEDPRAFLIEVLATAERAGQDDAAEAGDGDE